MGVVFETRQVFDHKRVRQRQSCQHCDHQQNDEITGKEHGNLLHAGTEHLPDTGFLRTLAQRVI